MAQPLTIAHVDTERGFSGGEVQVFLLMEGLARRGVRNVLFCPPGSAQVPRALELGIDVRPVPMRNDLHLAAVVRLSVRFAEGSIDLVHLHTGRANWLGGLAARIAGVPAITTRRMDRRVRRGPFTRFVYGRLVRRAVAIAPAVARLLEQGGVPVETIRTIPSSVDPERLRPTVPREELRAALGAAPGEVVLLVLARLHQRKGLDVLLDALPRVEGPTRLWIAGDGPEREALEAQARRLGLGGRVTFLGARDDGPDLLSAADVAVLPSRAEGLGIAALEAMAAGRPVVGSRVGGLADAVVDGRTGLLVPPQDVPALAAALRRVVQDEALRERLGAEGPGRIREGFHADQMVAAYHALYEEVLDEARARW